VCLGGADNYTMNTMSSHTINAVWECARASPNSSKKEQVEGYYDIYKIKIVKRNSTASIVTMLIIGKVT